MRAALTLCCTLGVDSSFAQVLGGPLCSFSKNSFIHLLAYSCFTLLGFDVIVTLVISKGNLASPRQHS